MTEGRTDALKELSLLVVYDLRQLADLIEQGQDSNLQCYLSRRLDVLLSAYFTAEATSRTEGQA